jgi:hypothetical protein
MIDVIIQSSAVGLFHALGVALAPLPRKPAPGAPWSLDWAGYADFDAPCMRGSLTLSLPDDLCQSLRFDGARVQNTSDLLRELTNQLLGRIKNRLVQFNVTLRTGLPTIVDRATLARRTAGLATLVYPFRTLRGEIAVTLYGQVNDSALVYTGGIETPTEGDIILF